MNRKEMRDYLRSLCRQCKTEVKQNGSSRCKECSRKFKEENQMSPLENVT